MPGQGPLPCGAPLCEGEGRPGVLGVLVFGAVVPCEVDVPLVADAAALPLSAELALELVAALAPPMPAAAPPAASAPATIVAPSILDTFIGDLLGLTRGWAPAIRRLSKAWRPCIRAA